MIYFIIILLVLLFFVSVVPIMQLLISNMNAADKVEYEFPSELFSDDMKELKYEDISDSRINRISIQNRGSVRLAQGNILSKTSLEDRKAKAYSVELP